MQPVIFLTKQSIGNALQYQYTAGVKYLRIFPQSGFQHFPIFPNTKEATKNVDDLFFNEMNELKILHP